MQLGANATPAAQGSIQAQWISGSVDDGKVSTRAVLDGGWGRRVPAALHTHALVVVNGGPQQVDLAAER